MSGKRICAVFLYPNRHLIDIFEELKPLGYGVDYFFFDQIPDYRHNNNWQVPDCSEFLSIFRPRGWLKLLSKSRSCDAVFFQSLVFPFLFNASLQLGVQWLRGNRFIISEGSRYPNRKRLLLKLISGLLLNSNSVQHLAIGTGAARDYYNYGFTNWRFRKFCFCEHYNPVQGETWQGADSNDIVILCVGRLLERKNFSQLLETMVDYAGTRNITIAICGTGPEEDRLRTLATRLPPGVRAHFAGHCNKLELDSYYRRADIFVLTSTYEGWGVVVNHALHFGLPLVLRSTVRSGIDYLLVENHNGFVFESNDSLKRALSRLIDDDELRNGMATFSVRHNQLWSMQSIVNRLDALIQNPRVKYEQGPLSDIDVDQFSGDG